MAKVVIGIHGLANKPRKSVLKDWWKKALAEGIARNCGHHGALPFELVYWADLLYKHPLHDDPDYAFDVLYNDEPYMEAAPKSLRVYRDSLREEMRVAGQHVLAGTIEGVKERFGFGTSADPFLARLLQDLSLYYDEARLTRARKGADGKQAMQATRRVLCDELKNELRRHRGKDVMLIAHSMGSIIAYDTLRDIGRSRDPADRDINVSHFVTMGSALGLPHVKGRVMRERDHDGNRHKTLNLRTPSCVTATWLNFADRRDPVAVDPQLHDDYHANAHHVRVVDWLVENDYRAPPRHGEKEGRRNPHKSYGYLRAPEVSSHVQAFLA